MTAQDVLDLWKELTGQSWRLVPYQVQVQAGDFAAAGFTREDMELVLRYTRAHIARGTNGFNQLSLTWRVLAEDNWAKFQERLDLAREALRRRPPVRRDVPVERQLPDGRTETVLAPPAEKPAVLIDGAKALRDFADKLAAEKRARDAQP